MAKQPKPESPFSRKKRLAKQLGWKRGRKVAKPKPSSPPAPLAPSVRLNLGMTAALLVIPILAGLRTDCELAVASDVLGYRLGYCKV